MIIFIPKMDKGIVDSCLDILMAKNDDWFAEFSAQQQIYGYYTYKYTIRCKEFIHKLYTSTKTSGLETIYKMICKYLRDFTYHVKEDTQECCHELFDYVEPYEMKTNYKERMIEIVKSFIIEILRQQNLKPVLDEMKHTIKNRLIEALENDNFRAIAASEKEINRLSCLSSAIHTGEKWIWSSDDILRPLTGMSKTFYVFRKDESNDCMPTHDKMTQQSDLTNIDSEEAYDETKYTFSVSCSDEEDFEVPYDENNCILISNLDDFYIIRPKQL